MKVLKLMPIAGLLACTSLSSSNDGGPDDGSVGIDTGVADAGKDTSNDATSDVVTEAGADSGATTYNDFTNTSFWTTFDLASKDTKAVSYAGGTFDGRYVYFAPDNSPNSSLFARYDTMAPFGSGTSWTLFDAAQIGLSNYGFTGAVFDGQHVYFVPYNIGTTDEGFVVQYDTVGSFTTSGSWKSHDMANGSHSGYWGGVFDGKYIYFVPCYNSDAPGYHGIVNRYDTTSSFTASGSYIPFDTTGVSSSAKGFYGGVFDGRYVYVAPILNGLITRYDTMGSYAANGAWSTFDTAMNINGAAVGYIGAGFDGRYAYFVPNGYNGNGSNGLVVRYDTTLTFSSSQSWQSFDATMVNANAKGFAYSAFDGRYIYFLPCNAGGAPSSELARYDTQGAFTSAGSWSVFDTTKVPGSLQVPGGAKGFGGAVFDGRYLYLVPNGAGTRNGLVLRFDAKSPPSMPKGYSGSFF